MPTLSAPAKARSIRWVLAHDPVSVFEEAARRFSEAVSRESRGQLEVRVFSNADMAPGRRLTPAEAIAKVAAGEIEMCQTYTSALGQLNNKLWVLDLPYLFRDHDHAWRVLDGAIGRDLMAGLLPHDIRGLAYTYSGGYRVISSAKRRIRRWEDLKGLAIRTSPSPVATALFSHLGARPVPALLDQATALCRSGEVEAAEITYPRYWHQKLDAFHPVLSDTHHSLLLTMIVVNERFYQSLPAAERRLLAQAARESAAVERATSLAEGEKGRRACLDRGFDVAALSAVEAKRFAKAARPVHERFAPLLGAGLIARVARA